MIVIVMYVPDHGAEKNDNKTNKQIEKIVVNEEYTEKYRICYKRRKT